VIASGLGLAGSAGIGLGLLWSLWFPVNKPLWTSSYAVLMAGLATGGLAACYWVIEVQGARGWARPFAAFGVNALALYFLSSLVALLLALIGLQAWLFQRLFAPWAASVNASLAYAVAYVVVWWAVMEGLYRAGLRLRV
jgi:predicted acyltransferase